MDFFLRNEELELYGDRIQPEVPWFGGDHDSTRRYPVVPLDQYLTVRGCTLPDDPADFCKWIVREPEAALPLVQSWLFFGLIEAALQDSFISEAHLTATPHGPMINTRFLVTMSISWELRLIGSPKSLSVWQESWRSTVSLAERMLSILSAMTRDPPGGLPLVGSTEEKLDHIIRLSTLLLEHLGTVAPPRLHAKVSGLPVFLSSPSVGMEARLKGRLLSQGWCPSTYNMLESISGCWHLREYACLFEATDQPPEKHDRCSESTCIANNVDPETAKAKHLGTDCDCPNICPNLDDILKATHGDSFPIINVSRLLVSGMFQIEKCSASVREVIWKGGVVPYEDGMKFVAISHVWSDGLMGTADTGLPQCQIQHLASVVQAASEEACNDAESAIIPYMWIDILCIPLEKRARKLAIQKMRTVYSKAAITVVLDSGMSKSRYIQIGTAISFRMMTCVWSQRLWTLQEAVLSNNVYILFKYGRLIQLSSVLSDVEAEGGAEPMSEDTVAELAKLCRVPEEVVRLADRECRSRPSNAIQGVALRELRSLPALSHGTLDISHVAQMLSLRDSSKRSDEILAIAPLLGVDLEGILDYVGEERVKKFWLKLGAVPKDVLVVDYPKLSIPGFRCLPKTMMKQQPIKPMQWRYENVAITNKGLRGNYWLYRWPEGCHPGFFKIPPGVVTLIVDREARQVISFRLSDRETRRDHVDINALLLLEQPPSYSPDTPTLPFELRGLGLWSTGGFHNGSEIFTPGKLMECRVEPPSEVRDVYQGGLEINGKLLTVIIG